MVWFLVSFSSELSKNYIVDIIDNFSRGKFDNEFKKLINKKNVNLIKIDLKKIKIKKLIIIIFHLAATIGVVNVINNPWDG